MFERFTDRARLVIVFAQEEARLFKHEHIGTEHLLLGLLRETDGVGGKALAALRVTLEDVRAAVEERNGVGKAEPKGHMPFTPRAKQVLELSLRQALRLGHSYLGTEHIVLGLVAEGEGVAAQILRSKVRDGLEAVRVQVLDMLGLPDTTYVQTRGREAAHRRSSLLHVNPDIVVRLEAIEARLSSIEALLRSQGEEREAQ